MNTSPSPSNPGSTIAALGQGGTASVDQIKIDGKNYARKRLNFHPDPVVLKDRIARFNREVELLQSIDFPYIIEIIDVMDYKFDESAEITLPAYTMPVASAPLDEHWKQNGGRAGFQDNIGEYLSYFLQASLGLAYLHTKDVLHRDFKPQNLLIFDGGLLQISDFGTSLDRDDPSSLTKTELVIHTPGYTAPEALYSLKHASKRSDVYAFGASLFHLVTGHPLSGVWHEDQANLTMIESPLRDLIQTCLNHNSEERFADGVELTLAFQTMCADWVAANPGREIPYPPQMVEALAEILSAGESRLTSSLRAAFDERSISLARVAELFTNDAIRVALEELEPFLESLQIFNDRYVRTTVWSNAETGAKFYGRIFRVLASAEQASQDIDDRVLRDRAKELASTVLIVATRLNRWDAGREFMKYFSDGGPLDIRLLDEIVAENESGRKFLKTVNCDRIPMSEQARKYVE
ncbi:serine/threonine-protein kinase [Corynebacterium sp. UBA2622]|uniref:serine/threonine-protein kinase n=1 Tax=Corynebacterium sp. UBA2622 TaxID=1946393 RepID=UPI0025B88782|nr:serine/threonine-protein kinase [Corynebacterium sp. UBA2622]